MGKIREGRWDCSACGSKGNLGENTDCPNCGKPRDPKVKFYLPEDAPEVTDPNLLKEAKAGPDWYCEHCNSSNRATQEACDNCGAPKGSSRSHKVGDYTPPPEEEPLRIVRNSSGGDSYSSTRSSEDNDDNDQPIRPANVKKIIVRTSLIASIILIGLLTFCFFKTKNVSLTLSKVTWERSIEVEKYKTVIEEDWDVPTGGRIIKRESKVRDHKKVLDHYETRHKTERVQTGTETEEYTCGHIDKGNGYFEDKTCTRQVPVYTDRDVEYEEPVYREEPIYDDWYKYEIERWKPERTVYSAGTDLKPYWPELHLAEKERQGKSEQKYLAYFLDPKMNKTYEMKMDLGQWQKLQLNGLYIGKVNAFGLLREVTQPEK